MPTAAEVRTLFDEIAGDYDRINFLMSWGRHRAWKKMAVDWCQPTQARQVADLCCGTGDLARIWLKKAPQAQVIGIDFSAAMLAQAHAQTLPNPRLSWMEADVLQLPLAAASLDGVTMAFGLRNILDLPRCFQELHRMLRPGAKAVILDLCRRQDDGFQSWYLREIVPRLGAAFGLRDQFAYLAPSLERFPTPAQQADYAQQAGFTGIQHRYVEQGALHFLILDK